jgi:hypothetical protein
MKDSIALKMFKGTTQKEKRRKKKMRKMKKWRIMIHIKSFLTHILVECHEKD